MCCTPFCNSVQRHEKTRPFQLSRSHQPLTPARLSRVYPAQRQPAMQPRARSNCPAMSRARRALPLHHLLLGVGCDMRRCNRLCPPKKVFEERSCFFWGPLISADSSRLCRGRSDSSRVPLELQLASNTVPAAFGLSTGLGFRV